MSPLRKRRFLSLLLSLAVLVGLTAAYFSIPAAIALEGEVKTVVIDGNQVDENPANRFKGFGALNCNNTGNLLLDYKEEHPEEYWNLMKWLFDEETGAGMSHVKIEMGNDSNTSSGTEPATMRTADERANVWRGMGFHFAQDAKKINPKVEISLLRWGEVRWATDDHGAQRPSNYEKMYKWYHDTAVSLYEDMGLYFDYISSDQNEIGTPDYAFYVWFADRMRNDPTFPNGDKIKIITDQNQGTSIPTAFLNGVTQSYTASWGVPNRVITAAEMQATVDVMGYHYNMGTTLNYLACNRDYNREIWYSEGIGPQTQARFRNQGPAGPLGGGVVSTLGVLNRYIGMYTHGRRTHYIFQPAIGAFYTSQQYAYKEIMGAHTPWNGNYEPDAGIWGVMHFTQFAGIDQSRIDRTGEGWYIAATFNPNGTTTADSASDCYGNQSLANKGIVGTGFTQLGDSAVDGSQTNAEYNRMTYVSPDKKDFSTVMVNDSPRNAYFEFKAKNIGNAGKPAQFWVTAGPDNADQEYDVNFYKHVADIAPVDNGDGTYSYFVTVKAYSMASLTTTTVNPNTGVARTEHARPDMPADTVLDMSTPENPDLMYFDDFEYAEYPDIYDEVLDREMSYVERRGGHPRYFADLGGAFEVAEGEGRGGGNAVMQQLTANAVNWTSTQYNSTLLGDARWSNYKASVDVNFSKTTTNTHYAILGVRHQIAYPENANANAITSSGYKLRLLRTGVWNFYRGTTSVATGTLADFDPAAWYTLSVQAVGNSFTFWIDGVELGTYTDTSTVYERLVGELMLGCNTGFRCLYDNLKVEKVEGYAPYFQEIIDDMDARVTYTGNWTHQGAGAAAGGTVSPGDINGTRYQRTRSNAGAGATVTIPFTGSGFSIIGETAATSVIRVFVDGEQVSDNINIENSPAGNYTGYRTSSYTLDDLYYGKHELKIEVVSGTFRFDAIGAFGKVYSPVEPIPGAVPIEITGAKVDAANAIPNALSFKGWGMLSCNATSVLLLDYKAHHPDKYWEMMEIMFGGDRPIFTHVKIEMGNDGNNSTGADAATMRSADEEANVFRAEGWQLAADAKRVNPDVKVSILRWRCPTWVGANNPAGAGTNGENMYKWYKETIFDAYKKYGYILDFVNPTINESSAQNGFVTFFKNKLLTETDFPAYMDAEAQLAFRNIKIVSDDTNAGAGPTIASSMISNAELRDIVDILAWHYTTSANANVTTLVNNYDKETWYSEGCASLGFTRQHINQKNGYGAGSIGGQYSPLNMVDNYLASFVTAYRSHYIFQPAIGAFYEGTQYQHKELLSARSPWSGYIHYDEALLMTAHWSKFSINGWDKPGEEPTVWRAIHAASASKPGSTDEHNVNTNGYPSYMTLAAPDKSDFSTVFINNHTATKVYSIALADMGIADGSTLYLWETKANSYLQLRETVELATDGKYYFLVEPFSAVTVTTLDPKDSGMDPLPPDPVDGVLDTDFSGKTIGITDDRYLYADDFEYAGYDDIEIYNAKTGAVTMVPYLESRGGAPRYMMKGSGAWEVVDGRLVQLLADRPSSGEWNSNVANVMVGDFRWMNYKASIDVQVNGVAGSQAAITIRSQTGMGPFNTGYNLRITRAGAWSFYRGGTLLGSGSVAADPNGEYNIGVQGAGREITAFVNGVEVMTYTDNSTTFYDSGRVKLASGTSGTAWFVNSFDNLKVEVVPGFIPYASAFYDNQDDEISIEGNWNVPNPPGGSADNWQRTLMTGTYAAGNVPSVSFPIDGTGFSIIGTNSAANATNCRLDLYVDDMTEPVATGLRINQCVARYSTFTYDGLADGPHDIKLVITAGAMAVDAIYVLAPVATFDDRDLVAAMKAFEALNQFDYTPESWALADPESAYAAALAVYNDPYAKQAALPGPTQDLLDAIDALVPLEFSIGSQPVSVVLRKGMTYQIKIESNSPTTLFYISSNANATVSATGLVTAVKTGSAVITVIDVYAQKYFTVAINISS